MPPELDREAGNIGSSYAITITLQPNMYKLKPRNQYKRAVWEINRVLFPQEHFMLDYIRPEITAAANVHFHGVLIARIGTIFENNILLHDLFRKSKIIGFIYIKEIDDYPKWKEYCDKEIAETNKILKLDRLVTSAVNTIELEIRAGDPIDNLRELDRIIIVDPQEEIQNNFTNYQCPSDQPPAQLYNPYESRDE